MQEVVCAFVGALENIVGTDLTTDTTNKALVLRLLEQWAGLLERDLRPGENMAICTSDRFSVSSSWWLPVSSEYVAPPVATWNPSPELLAANPLESSVPPRLGSNRLQSTRGMASSVQLYPSLAEPLWTQQFIMSELVERGNVTLIFARDEQQQNESLICGQFVVATNTYDTTVCGAVNRVNDSHVECDCGASQQPLALLLLNVLPDGDEVEILVPGPAGAKEVVPVSTTLPAGLAVAGLVLLALVVLLVYYCYGGFVGTDLDKKMTWVSTGVAASTIVPADNRVSLPGTPEVSSEALVDGGVYNNGKETSSDNIWASEEDDEDEPLRSVDLINDDAKNTVGWYDVDNDLW
jgi:hypothetical protein